MPEALHPFHDLMLQAVALAQKSRWQTLPNPCVGALLVKGGRVVASGRHKGPGLPHAEVEALSDAAARGISPSECSLVVTLEPCRHYGKTPPCTEAVLKAGIRKVIVGALDPNPEASGGAEILRAAGVHVETHVAHEACLDLIDDFIIWQTTGLPYTLLKLASTLDGRIATRTGESQWISSRESRKAVHHLRARVQAVLVGGNTFYRDNPRLTSRLEQAESACPEQPLAVVVSSRLPDADATLHLVSERPESTIFWTGIKEADSPKAKKLRTKGVRVLGLPHRSHPAPAQDEGAGLDLAFGLGKLRAEYGCRYVLCEGGGKLGLSLLRDTLAHEVYLHMAPKIFADNAAAPLFDGLAPEKVDDALGLRFVDAAFSGGDLALALRPPRTTLYRPAATRGAQCSPA